MPPPRPRGVGCNTGIAPARSNPNAPMSERQQMALLIQMTASSDNSRQSQKNKDYKKDDDFEESNSTDKADIKEKTDELASDSKKEIIFENVPAPETSNLAKRLFSDIEEDESDEIDDAKKKKKKDLEISKDSKQSNLRILNRVDKNFKQSVSSKSSTTAAKSSFQCEKDEVKNKFHDTDLEDDDSKSDPLYSGGLKVPPLKIVIPQQSCGIDGDGNSTRTGKINISRNAALPYVVSSNSDSNERDTTVSNTSPRDSPIKINLACGIDDKNCKLMTEEKNLRVLRSAHRIGLTTHDRNSNNSSPQIPSNSPSPASSTMNELNEGKAGFTNANSSPTHLCAAFETANISNLPSPSTSSTSSSKETIGNVTELHPRKRKIRTKNDDLKAQSTSNAAANNDPIACTDSHPHDVPFTNCYQMYMTIRKQIEKKWKTRFSVKPRPPQGFNEYLINKKTYLLHGRQPVNSPQIPQSVPPKMKDIFLIQQKERTDLEQRHTVEKEKLCLNVEQEIIRIHSKAARSMSCQTNNPFSVCTHIKDEEVYNMVTPEIDDKDKNARSRFNGRLLLSWLQDVDDKWEKIKESMLLRHHNEAESLHAVQLMDWELALKQFQLCDLNSQTAVDRDHVPIVHVGDDFDLLPA